jgi:acyl carrier protein
MELLSEVTEKYEVDVDPEDLQDVRTVGDVVSFLATLLDR